MREEEGVAVWESERPGVRDQTEDLWREVEGVPSALNRCDDLEDVKLLADDLKSRDQAALDPARVRCAVDEESKLSQVGQAHQTARAETIADEGHAFER